MSRLRISSNGCCQARPNEERGRLPAAVHADETPPKVTHALPGFAYGVGGGSGGVRASGHGRVEAKRVLGLAWHDNFEDTDRAVDSLFVIIISYIIFQLEKEEPSRVAPPMVISSKEEEAGDKKENGGKIPVFFLTLPFSRYALRVSLGF
ncbi:hypothetical protein GW17_00008873 [Ensete ventricosum]|nr:hypothetical protein GW17_00008873 [Ensete ventricosum]